ncbi:MAG TPA: OsmC family peroxiredoxin [Opitutaceae bacterium]|nr:OsmC family peroxiredoxin [Opitutaceae bacterium]
MSTILAIKRTASAVWNGSHKDGSGNLTAPSGVLHSTQYTFGSRFESSPGVSPDELIAAAHAGCYAMALSAALGDAGFDPDRLEVNAEVTLEDHPPLGWTLTSSHLTVTARVASITSEKFLTVAEQAKACAVSRALNVPTTLEAKLV